MRKQLRLAAIAALGALTCSCIHEREFVQYALEPEAISFVLGSTLTRAEKEATPQVNRYSLGTDDHGNLFTLEETVSWLDDIGDTPVTRGTPAYSENIQDALGSAFNGRAYSSTNGTTPVIVDGAFYAMEDGHRWRRAFGFDPWPESDDLTFFINMPVEAPGLTITGYNPTNGTISFSYQTPETAEEQQDILFAKTTLNKESYIAAYESNAGGAPILLRHALTGIKFAIASNINDTDEDSGTQPEGQVETFITKVEFIGLKGKGTAVYHQDDSNESASTGDKQGDNYHSSKTSFTWTYDTTAEPMTFSQEYSEENIIDYSYDEENPDQVGAAESFYLAGNERNLNDEKASMTFWFIPQTMTADVKVRVTFYVWDGVHQGEEVTRELNLGSEILSQNSNLNYEWKAGQIRTVTLSPTSIDVDITAEPDDEVENTLGTPVIRNTGNKEAYLRVAIVGNWVDAETGEIVLGYDKEVTNASTGETTYTYATIAPWNENNTDFGTFTNLGASGAWVQKSDGYWYYTRPVPAGMKPGETSEGGSYIPLFEAYTKAALPIQSGTTVLVPDTVDLMLDLAVQAVDAKAGNTYEAAWATTVLP